ncbi:GGDEF/EAL domain-containing response regulator [Roseospira visakhapatnamensis]|uniref:Diguanylate cyclase (GGDEF)-like protein/PAS domain S-box-containing protein n=1 Tax=Roseospira visakhapatnamensis TaxID=390880 RepID=A0A7W6RCI7_9PROT|nr:EAL domain-containing protein [Roseospira visakhapatnamensis]MBB4265484.1 diguanylate cyclase (GGDEF)-like protein/PAS domain S-box-containing protein [Roseospira visakhapatnamensis]
MRHPDMQRNAKYPLILVVDDDPTSLRTLLEALREEYDISVATNAKDAWDALFVDDMPDLILLDIMMPDMDGYRLCQKIKQDERARKVPVMFMTALTDDVSEAHGFSLGAVDYIHKPFKIPLVRARVRTHMTTRGMMDDLLSANQRLCDHIVRLQQDGKSLSDGAQNQSEGQIYQNLMERILDNTAEGVIISDTTGKIIRVNPSFTRISGFTEEDVLGHDVREFKPLSHDSEHGRGIWELLEENGRWHGELSGLRKNGETYPEFLTASTIRGQAGLATYYVIIFNDASAALKTQEKIDRLTWYDSLTGLPNRLLYLDRLNISLRYCKSTDMVSATLVLDVDSFRSINDARGLPVGDRILQEIGNRISAEIQGDGTVARMAADEFAIILLPSEESKQEVAERALAMAERIQGALASHFQIDSFNFVVTCSFGVSIFPTDQNDSPEKILQCAEIARSRAMKEGGNKIFFFDKSMGQYAKEKFSMVHDLRSALEHQQLQVFLQTQVSSADHVIGAEALVRWNHPVRGMVSPEKFIPVAEETGLIVDLDRWVLQQAVRLIQDADAQGKRLRVSVNISPPHFADATFSDHVCHTVHAAGIDPTLLVLEVTEGLMLHDIDVVIEKMKKVGDTGVKFSLDDFGSGYSSLSYLKRLPIHEVKIDKSFVLDAPTDSNDALIIDMIYSIGNVLRIDVVAEGVETDDHAQYLKKYKGLIRQGYFFGRPQPMADWLRDNLHRI